MDGQVDRVGSLLIAVYLFISSSFTSLKLMQCLTDLAIRIWTSKVSWKIKKKLKIN